MTSTLPPTPVLTGKSIASKNALTAAGVSSISAGLRHLAGKKNANKLKDEEIKAIFIARQVDLASIMADISSTQTNDAAQHHLIIGQRGMGKSTLLRRIEAELRGSEYASRFIPLAFPEEHYARVRLNSLSEFWLNCLDSLANAWHHQDQDDEAKRLDDIIRNYMRSKASEDDLAAQCKQTLDEELARTGRRAVLLLDNFVKLMARLPKHDWALRTWLQTAGGPVLVAANVEYPSELTTYAGAFYDGMKTRWIGRLGVAEVLQVMRTLVEQENRPRDMLNQLNQSRPRLEALHALTGGNPRTVIYLYQLLVGGLSEHIEQDLKRLMDDIDALYEVRLNNLADQAYEVFAALALGWRPQSAAQLKVATGLAAGGVSGQLGRLEEYGLIEKVPLFDSKKTGYQVAERLFNIWYLERIGSRRDAAPVESLAAFLEAFYTPDTLRQVSQKLMNKARWDRGDLAQMVASNKVLSKYNKDDAALTPFVERTHLEAARQMALDDDRINAELQAIIQDTGQAPSKTIVDFAKLEKALEKCVPKGSTVKPQEFAEAVLGSMNMLRTNSKKGGRNKIAASGVLNEEKIQKLMSKFKTETTEIKKLFGAPAAAWINNTLLNGKLTNLNDESQLVNLIDDANDVKKLELIDEIMPISMDLNLCIKKKICELDPNNAEAWSNLGFLYKWFERDYINAENCHKKAVQLDNTSQVFVCHLGEVLVEQKKYAEAEIIYKRTINQIADSAIIYGCLGDLLNNNLERYDEAEIFYRKAIKTDGKNSTYFANLARLLHEKNHQYNDAEKYYSKGFEISAPDDLYLEMYGNSYGNLLHDYLGKHDEAKKIYEQTIILIADDVCAPYNLGFLLRDSLSEFTEAKILLSKYAVKDSGSDTLALHHALFSAYEDNWGDAKQHFVTALERAKFTLPPHSRDDWFRACAVLLHIGGAPAIERLLSWIDELDATAKLLPLVEALQALVLGSRDALMNSPAEVRPVAASIYDEIDLRRKHLPAATAWKKK